MTTANFPQVGDQAVDLRLAKRSYELNQCGDVVTVKAVMTTIVLTSDGERYNRASLKPVTEGRFSNRELVPFSDVRVLVVQARERLAEVATLADNLAKLPEHRTPEDILAGLARIIMAASEARRQVVEIMREASKTEQESPR
jgi:hypothetical protein